MDSSKKIAVATALVAVALLLGGSLVARLFAPAVELTSGSNNRNNQDDATPSLTIETLMKGDETGAVAAVGDTVTVQYVGKFEDGQIFDSSYSRGEPFVFRLGAGQVITGWDVGLQGMRAGDKRRLTIPPELAYGAAGRGPIPPNATLVFDVELISVEKAQ